MTSLKFKFNQKSGLLYLKITVINGNSRHGSTWHCMDMLIKEISKFDETDIKEFICQKTCHTSAMAVFHVLLTANKPVLIS